MKWFLDLAGFSRPQIDDLLRLSQQLDLYPEPNALSGKVLTLLMLRSSFHTRASMGAAMGRLGGTVINIAPSGSGWEIETSAEVMDGPTVHHALELIPSMGAYSDALGIRSPGSFENLAADLNEQEFTRLCKASPVPMINMESAINHPCQGLAAWKSMNDADIPERGGRLVLAWTYEQQQHPFGTAAAALHMAALRGMRVTILRPDEYALPQPLLAKAQRAASQAGGCVIETADKATAFDTAHVVCAESWVAPGCYADLDKERTIREKYRDWCIDERWFKPAVEDCRLIHSLPVRRGQGVAGDVLNGPRSLVTVTARNRMLVQMAVLYRMLKK
ncbi:MAG: hypothetical protein HKN70_13125 [Gammaproteobacteria bacterium]|nr:hypothetical protein [Gammaproteobacteria bacterium]